MTFSFRSFRNVEFGFGDVKLLIYVSVSVFSLREILFVHKNGRFFK